MTTNEHIHSIYLAHLPYSYASKLLFKLADASNLPKTKSINIEMDLHLVIEIDLVGLKHIHY